MTKMLVVDDEQVWREGLTQLFAELLGAGSTIISVGTGEEAITALRRDEFALISADILLKGSSVADGRRVLREAKARGCRAAIVVTAMNLDRDITTVLTDGKAARVTFPVFLADLFPGANIHFSKPGPAENPAETLAVMRTSLTRKKLDDLAGLAPLFLFDGLGWSIRFEGESVSLRKEKNDYLFAIQVLLSRYGQQITCDELERQVPGHEHLLFGPLYEDAQPNPNIVESLRAIDAELALAKVAGDSDRARELGQLRQELQQDAARGTKRQSREGKLVSKRVSLAIGRAIKRIQSAGGRKIAEHLKAKIKTGFRLYYPKGQGTRWRTE